MVKTPQTHPLRCNRGAHPLLLTKTGSAQSVGVYGLRIEYNTGVDAVPEPLADEIGAAAFAICHGYSAANSKLLEI